MLNNYEYFEQAAMQWNIGFELDNEWFETNNLKVACITRMLNKRTKEIFYVIKVDNNFFNLSFETQKFVFNHEIGHFHQHNENRHKFMTAPERELDADEYAKERIGGRVYAIKALTELKNQTYWDDDKKAVDKIFNIRINCIMKKIKTI